jgi:hypothetical protein
MDGLPDYFSATQKIALSIIRWYPSLSTGNKSAPGAPENKSSYLVQVTNELPLPLWRN